MCNHPDKYKDATTVRNSNGVFRFNITICALCELEKAQAEVARLTAENAQLRELAGSVAAGLTKRLDEAEAILDKGA